jgi:hypothetical protein
MLELLILFCVLGLIANWFARDPDRGNFEAFRTHWSGCSYIQGNGLAGFGLGF